MKSNLFLPAMFFFLSLQAYSQSAGPLNPMSASYSAFGCLACPGGEWNDLANISLADHQYANALLAAYPSCFQATCFYSRILYASDFGFTIPTGAVITGITADMLRMSTAATGVVDSAVRLYTGSPVGINHALTSNWTPNPLNVHYGDSTDTWGYALTSDSINSAQFGLAVLVINKNLSATFFTASIDQIQMTVYYSTGTGIQSQTKSAGILNAFYNKASSSLFISANGIAIKSIRITDVTGNKILTSELMLPEGKTMELPLPKLRGGLYFLQAETDGRMIVQKFIVD